MKNLNKQLDKIFEEHKQKYISVYDKSGRIESTQKNAIKFSPIHKKLTKELISKANDFLEVNDSYPQSKAEDKIKKLVLEFGRSMVNPF